MKTEPKQDKSLTVQQLIEILEKCPNKDLPVWYQHHSNYHDIKSVTNIYLGQTQVGYSF